MNTTTSAPKYLNRHGYSDVFPFEVVRIVSDKTVEVRAMASKQAPDWKPEIVVGGFVGHCVNNHDQRWVIESDPTAKTIRLRLSKRGAWKASNDSSVFLPADEPRRHHDWNF